MKQLLDSLRGERDESRKGTLRERAAESARVARRVLREREFGYKAKTYGGAVASGAVLVAIGMTKLIAEIQEQNRQAMARMRQEHDEAARQQHVLALDQYLEDTIAG